MALAYKEGKLPLHQVPMGARNAVKSMAQMVPGKLREFTRRDKRGYTLLGG